MTALGSSSAGRWRNSEVDGGLVAELHQMVGEQLSALPDGENRLSAEDERAFAHKLLNDEFRRMAKDALGSDDGRLLNGVAEEAVRAAVMDRLWGLGRIQPLLEDPEVRDIHIGGCAETWVVLRDGSKVRGPAAAGSDGELVELVSTAARRLGRSERRWDAANPMVELELPTGDRLHAVMGVSRRPVITIRRHDLTLHRLAQLVERGLCDEVQAGFLTAAVRARCNLIVSGGVNTGKTTTLRCLLNEIDLIERLITIEDHSELGLWRVPDLHPDCESLEAREANTEGTGQVTLADLVRAALRMDPDRVIVGEVRGAEVLPMLLAMSQGNDGSMCTIHANSSRGVIRRLAMYGLLAEERLQPEDTAVLVAEAVDLIVHLGWRDGHRQVVSIREVTGGMESGQVATNELWRDGHLKAPPSMGLADRLAAQGWSPAMAAPNGRGTGLAG